MILTKPRAVGSRTSIHFSEKLLQSLPCGLHRATLNEALLLLPQLTVLYKTCPINVSEWDDWLIDVKIHMLMDGQYPCIPNWHTDNVPRVDGKTRFDLIDEGNKPMYLWLSNGPATEFLANDVEVPTGSIKSHNDLSVGIQINNFDTYRIASQQWYSMTQLTPHRGAAADCNQWRVFVRLTHKSIDSERPVMNKVRRHAQVYLDAQNFTW